MTLLEQAKAALRQCTDALEKVPDSCHTCDTLAQRLIAVERERDAARKAGNEAVAELLEALEDMLAVYGGLPNTFCFGEAETQDDDAKEAEAKARVAIAKARVLDTLAFGNDTEHVSPESGKLLDAVPVKK